MTPQYGELRHTSGWDQSGNLGPGANFRGFHVLAALLHGTLVVGDSQTLWRWTEGAIYIRQGGHHIGHWPTFYTASQKNVPPLVCYNFDIRERILIFFGRNVTDKVSNQKTLFFATWNNLCFCTTWQNRETRKSHFVHSNAESVHCQKSTSRSLISSVFLTQDSYSRYCMTS